MDNGKQMRYSDEEISLIQHTFKGNEKLLRLMRKVFLPELEADAPLGQMIDLWMTAKVDDMTPEQAMINIKARNSLILHVDQQLLSLKLLAETSGQTPEEAVMKLKKDSNK